MPPSKNKGKAPAHRSNSGGSRRRALEHAITMHYDKKKRRASRRALLDDSDLLDVLQSIDEPSTDNDSDNDSDEDPATSNAQAPSRSEEEWEAIRRSNEAMSEELAHLRAMVTRDSQLANGATPGASGSRPRSGPPKSEDAPVALGQPAFDDPPARRNPDPPAHRNPDPPAHPPRSTPEGRPRGFIALPKSKTAKNLKDIQNDAGLSDNNERWLEISNIIRDLMTRVGMDYTNSWLRQDKTQLGILYSLILKEAPELGVFQNGWATEWLVQNKFNNHRYYMGNRKRKYSSIKEEDDEQGRRLPPSPPPQALPCPADDEQGYGDDEEGHGPPPPPKEDSPPLEASPPPPALPLTEVLPPPDALPLPSCSLSQPPAAREPTPPPVLPAPGPASHLHSPTDPPSSSRPERSHTRRPQNNPGTRYNTRTRAAALASAAAQTTMATKQSDKQSKTTGQTPRGKNQRHKSESPLRPLEESDDGGRLTDEEDD